MKKILSCLLSFVFIFSSINPAYADSQIEDNASLFNEYASNINNIVNQYEDIYKMNIVVLSDINIENISEYSHTYYNNKYSDSDGIIFAFNKTDESIDYYVETFGNFIQYTHQDSLEDSYQCVENIQNTLYELGLQYDHLEYSKYIVDEAALLTKSQYRNLSFKLNDLVNEYDMDIVIYTTYLTKGDMQSFADDYYDYHGYREDGYILVLDMTERYWYISTSGLAIHSLYDSRLDSIADNALSSLSNGYYYNTFVEYLNQSSRYLNNDDSYNNNYHKDNNYSDYPNYDNDPNSIINNLLTALVASILISLLINYGRLRTLKTKRAVYDANNYIKENSFQLTNKQDLFLFRTMNKRRKPQNNTSRSSGFGGSSSGRSSVHRSSSGRSHGGRGGRF